MTAADKFGIAFSIGFTVVLIAIAMSFATPAKTAPMQPAPMPVPPTPAPAPAPTPAPAEEPTTPPAEETPTEETPEQTPEEVPEEQAPVEETPEEEPAMEEAPEEEMIMSADVSIPEGASTPGCEADNACFVPAETTVSVGGTVTWTNEDTAAHTVTSGTPTDGPDGVFDSSIIAAGNTFEHTFEEAGEYDYFCIVHPWMAGKVTVE